MWDILAMAFALMLVLEGLLPFLMPGAWRDAFRKLTEISDSQIRFHWLDLYVGRIADSLSC